MKAYHTLPDIELVALLKEGNRGAFAEIYNRYKGILFVHAYKRLLSPDEAEDAVHDLFAALWSGRLNFNLHTGNLSGYLYSAVRNRVLKVIAKRQFAEGYLVSLEEPENAATDHRLRENQLKAIIEKEVALLPARMREIFELSRNAQLSHKEIALQLDVSEKTVKNQINNALKILRVKLGLFVFLYFLINH